MALIRLSNIEKSFQDGEDRENNVLRGINMEVEKENARNIASLFSEINLRMRTTIVMVTHSDETSSFAHRILKLNGGILE